MVLSCRAVVKRFEGEVGQWIDQGMDIAGQTELDQAKFLPVHMKTVGFGVHGHAVRRGEVGQKFGELLGIGDQKAEGGRLQAEPEGLTAD